MYEEVNITNRSGPTVLDRYPDYFIFKMVINVPFGLLILVSNVLTLIAIHRNPQLRNVTNIFIASLSFADLLNAFPISLIRLLVFVEDQHLSHDLHMAVFAALTLSSSLSIFSHAALAVDRLIAIVWPLSYKRLITPTRAHMVTSSIWIFNVTTVSIMMIHFGRSMKEIQAQLRFILHLPLVLPREIYYGIVMPEIVIFLSISAVCYVRIFFAIKYRTAYRVTGPHSRPRDTEMARAAALTTALILLLLIGSWAPFTILTTFIDIKKFYTVTSYFFTYEFSVYLLYSNSFLNPLILYVRNRDYRKAYRDIMCLSCTSLCKDSSPAVTSRESPKNGSATCEAYLMEEGSNRVPIDMRDGPTDITELPRKQSPQLDENSPVSSQPSQINGETEHTNGQERSSPGKALMTSDL